MALMEISGAKGNSWREPERRDSFPVDSGRDRAPSVWSDAAAIGQEAESWLADLASTRRVVAREIEFLGSVGTLPCAPRNTWREPLDGAGRGALA